MAGQIGQMFTMVVYAQLIVENCKIYDMDEVMVDQMFHYMVKDFSKYAHAQILNHINTETQEKFLTMMMKKAVINLEQEKLLWKDYVLPNCGAYVMNESRINTEPVEF